METMTYPKTITWQLSQSIGERKPVVITDLGFEKGMVQFYLSDARIIGVPLQWFPLLEVSTDQQRSIFRIESEGTSVIWPDIDQQITLRDVLTGAEPCAQCWFRVSYYK